VRLAATGPPAVAPPADWWSGRSRWFSNTAVGRQARGWVEGRSGSDACADLWTGFVSSPYSIFGNWRRRFIVNLPLRGGINDGDRVHHWTDLATLMAIRRASSAVSTFACNASASLARE
jgi:hypothetical protein